jgi:hypothetical protein
MRTAHHMSSRGKGHTIGAIGIAIDMKAGFIVA